MPAEFPEGVDDVEGGEAGPGDLGEHRVEDEDVALGDQGNPPGPVLSAQASSHSRAHYAPAKPPPATTRSNFTGNARSAQDN